MDDKLNDGLEEYKDCCENCKHGNTEGCIDYGGFKFDEIFEDEIEGEEKPKKVYYWKPIRNKENE